MDTPREQAIVDFAVRLTNDAAGVSSSDLEPMRQAGMSDLEIYDVRRQPPCLPGPIGSCRRFGEPAYPDT